ncbi:MAG: CpsD/CapB family tyrosine-protein kinase [Eubacteriales bacterium]|jgi:capsular exopolysaccharide synthesis family protein
MKRIRIRLPEMRWEIDAEYDAMAERLIGAENAKIICVSSCAKEATRGAVSLLLARKLVQKGCRVVLMDMDLRKAMPLARIQVKNEDSTGISRWLASKCVFSDILLKTNVDGLFMVLAGEPVNDGTKLLKETRFGELLQSLEKAFDFVLIDIPPITESVDSTLVAKQCDGALLIIEAGKTDADFAQKTAGRFESAGCPVLGAVLNNADVWRNRRYFSKYGPTDKKAPKDAYAIDGVDDSEAEEKTGTGGDTPKAEERT